MHNYAICLQNLYQIEYLNKGWCQYPRLDIRFGLYCILYRWWIHSLMNTCFLWQV